MNQRYLGRMAALGACALFPACGLLGGGAPDPVLEGTVLHGRYLDPGGQLSIRIPGGARMRGLRAQVDGQGSGSLAAAGSWGGTSRFAWAPVPSAQLAEETFQRVREQVLDEIQSQVPEAELVYTEPLEYQEDPAELFVIHVPGGSPWSRVEWFRSTPLDLRITFLQFRRGDLALQVASDDTPRWLGGAVEEPPGVDPRVGRRRARLIELADRICLDDPLAAELLAHRTKSGTARSPNAEGSAREADL